MKPIGDGLLELLEALQNKFSTLTPPGESSVDPSKELYGLWHYPIPPPPTHTTAFTLPRCKGHGGAIHPMVRQHIDSRSNIKDYTRSNSMHHIERGGGGYTSKSLSDPSHVSSQIPPQLVSQACKPKLRCNGEVICAYHRGRDPIKRVHKYPQT